MKRVGDLEAIFNMLMRKKDCVVLVGVCARRALKRACGGGGAQIIGSILEVYNEKCFN